MKIKGLFTCLAVLLLSAGAAFGQSISLESVTGLDDQGRIPVDQQVTFNLRVTASTTTNHGGITNGFRIFSPDGATWTGTTADTLVSGWDAWFDLIYAVNLYSVDGMLSDTVAFGGSRLFGTGLPAGFDQVAYSITIGPVPPADHGKTIVLDSSFYGATGVWKWLGATAAVTFFPAWSGPHSYTIFDPNAGPTNEPPVLGVIGNKSVDEGQLLSFVVSATDPNGADVLTFSNTTLPPGATFIDNGDRTATFSWTPGFDDDGDYPVTFTVSDGEFSDDEAITITVNNVNQPPVLAAIGPQSVDENSLLTFLVSATDPDGTIPTLGAAPLPAGATFVDNLDGTGTFSWTPTFDDAGPYNVTFIAGDGVDSDDEVVVITVNNVNRPPVLGAIGPQSVNEGFLLSFVVSASDPDGGALTLTADPLPSGATFLDNGDGTGTFEWTPTTDDDGIYNVLFTVSDGDLTDDESVEITVVDATVNQPPVLAAIGPQSVDENSLLTFLVSATDPDGTIPTLGAAPLPAGATFVDNLDGTGTFSWTPTFDDAGPYNVTFSASDGVESDDEIVVITVNNVNRPPVLAAIGPQSVNEGSLLSFVVSASDPDGGALTLTADPLPSGATFLDNGDGTGTFEWTPTTDDDGIYNVLFTVSDGDLTDDESVEITVVDVTVNLPPSLAAIGPQNVVAGDSLNFVVTATDPNLTTPTLGADSLPVGSNFIDNGDGTGSFSWQTTEFDAGVYSVIFFASDGELADTEVVEITVSEAPVLLVVLPPVINFTATAGGGNPVSQGFSVTEASTANIAFAALENAGWFGLSADTGVTPMVIQVSVDIAGLVAGPYTDTIVITSGDADNSPQLVAVNLTLNPAENSAPFFTSTIEENYTITECDVLEILFTAEDADGDFLAFGLDPLVDNMTFSYDSLGNANFAFDPDFSQAGTYPMLVFVTDFQDTTRVAFLITVEECEPGAEGDTVSVATVPAVPGAQIVVPVSFANSCDLWSLNLSLGWFSEFITLDSFNYVDSRLDSSSRTVVIDNDGNSFGLTVEWLENSQAPGTGNLINLYFSLAVETPAGFYPIETPLGLINAAAFTRDCGGGQEEILPVFIPGGIVVDTSGNYVCGYVVDTAGNPIPGATVELWDNFPTGSVHMTTISSGSGVFAFSDFTTIPFDLWAYQDGYYPGSVENINFAQSGIMIVLTPYEDVYPTNTNVRFYCPEPNNIYMGGLLPVGSVIDAYDPDGVRCGSFIVRTPGEYGFLYVYGEEPFNEGDQGAEPTNVIRFFVNGHEALTSIVPVWTADLDVWEVCLEVPEVQPHVCSLVEGWNLVSWNVDTPSDSIFDVLASIGECLEVVMGFEQGALTYDSDLPMFSDLWHVDHLSGYWIKVNCDVDLEIEGTAVPATTPIPLTAGWNLVSYLPDFALPTDEGFNSIAGDIIVALGWDPIDSALTYIPGNEFSDLDELMPCFGYWIKTHGNATLVYPGAGGGGELVVADNSGERSFVSKASASGVIPTTSWMNLYSHKLTLNGKPVSQGAEISAYSESGLKIGLFVMKEEGHFGFMPVYGDAPATKEADGVRSGESFYLMVDGVKTEETFIWSGSGEKLEIKGLTSKTTSDETLPSNYSLKQNYPNPFNPSTTISFELPVAGQAKVEVFDLLGRLVAVPHDAFTSAGTTEFVWNGENNQGQTVASGIYFYRLTTDNFTETRKMTLLK